MSQDSDLVNTLYYGDNLFIMREFIPEAMFEDGLLEK